MEIFSLIRFEFLIIIDLYCHTSVLSAMDRDALKKQIENMKYQASMERWPLSKSIAA